MTMAYVFLFTAVLVFAINIYKLLQIDKAERRINSILRMKKNKHLHMSLVYRNLDSGKHEVFLLASEYYFEKGLPVADGYLFHEVISNPLNYDIAQTIVRDGESRCSVHNSLLISYSLGLK